MALGTGPLRDPIRTKDRFLVFGAPAIEQAEIDEVVRTMRTGWLSTGPQVARFEQHVRQYKSAPHAVAVHSCSAALHLGLLAAGVGPGDEVITTPMTFCATVNAIIHTGATPVLADIDAESLNIDPRQIRSRISSRTKAILPVHFAGRSCEMQDICTIAGEYGLKVIEDCAHALETTYRGQPAGTLGDFGCLSFYVTKSVATGEGGMVLARDGEAAGRIKALSLHGMTRDAWQRFGGSGYRHYDVAEAGFKYNMMDLQAAIGVHQLRRAEDNWKRRSEIWRRYDEAFRDLPVRLPVSGPDEHRHARHLYTIFVSKDHSGISRDAFLDAMTRQGIGVGVHYVAIPDIAYYRQRLSLDPEDCPVAVQAGRETVSLPLTAKLAEEDVDDVIRAVRRVLAAGP